MSQSHLFQLPELPFERKQLPQIVVNVGNPRKATDPLEPILLPWAQRVGSSNLPLEWAEFKRTVRLKFELRHDETPEDKIKLNPDTLLFEVQNNEASQIGLVVGAIRDLGPSDADRVGEVCNRTPMGLRLAQSGG